MNISNITFAASLWALATTASALSLGGSRGNVVLGAPVDLAFDVQPDPGSDIASSCVTARLVVGDNAIGDHRVRVSPLPDVAGRSSAVRVQANIVVDEPVVTVTLAAGCAGKITRTYTFLPEFPIASVRSAAPALPVLPSRNESVRIPGTPGRSADLPSVAAGPGTKAPGSLAPLMGLTPSTSAPSALDRAAAAPVRAHKKPAEVPAPTNKAPVRSGLERKLSASKALAVPAEAASRSRLVVEPLEDWLDSAVTLRGAPLLSQVPTDEPSQARADAAALWKWLNAQNEAVDPSAAALQAATAEATKAKAQAASDKAAALALQNQLETSERERFSGTVVYALGGLLLLALMGAAWLWSRLRKSSAQAEQAWRDSVELHAGEPAGLSQGRSNAASNWAAPETVPVSVLYSEDDSGLDDLDIRAAPETVPTPLPPAPPAPAAFREADVRIRQSMGAVAPAVAATAALAPVNKAPALHIVNPEELFDLLQQADFFTSVGEHGQAIDVLQKHIAQRGEASPLAYFELLSLYHTLSRTYDFEQLRMEAMQLFNVDVPDFANFHRKGSTLFYYTDALAEIEAEWASSSVLLVLERLLFRHAEGGALVDRFDLAAYSDLLLLLSVAQTTKPAARGDADSRQRTTPHAPPAAEASSVPDVVLPMGGELLPDPFDAGMDFDFDFHPSSLTKVPASRPATIDWRATAQADGASLDLDLSDQSRPSALDLQLPAMSGFDAVAPATGPAAGDLGSDMMDLKLDLTPDTRSKKD